MIFNQDDDSAVEKGKQIPVERDTSDLYWEDDEYVTIRPAWYRIGRGLLLLGTIVLLGWLGFSAARGWFNSQLDPAGEAGEAITVIVPAGATTSDIGRQLEQLDVIPNSTFFRYYAQWKGEGNFQAGEYTLQENSSADDVFVVLNEGPKPQVYERFTVQEGLWITEMIPLIASQLENVTEQELWNVLDSGEIVPRYRPEDTESWEGLLFPDTYEVNADADALEVLLKMSDEFTSVTGGLSYGAAQTQLGYSAYEVLVVASLIEAETRVPEERPQVASVIYNRLREGWALGIDATCIYAAGDRQVALTNDELFAEGPYNCRVNTFLPPTPINAPSRSSLEAARNPAETDYFYYVLTDPSGAHTFATTAEEFNAAKAICAERGLGCG